MHEMVKDINHFYLQHPELWEKDFEWAGYEWIDFSDADHSVISYLRKADGRYLAVVHNFTPETVPNYLIKLSRVKKAQRGVQHRRCPLWRLEPAESRSAH